MSDAEHDLSLLFWGLSSLSSSLLVPLCCSTAKLGCESWQMSCLLCILACPSAFLCVRHREADACKVLMLLRCSE